MNSLDAYLKKIVTRFSSHESSVTEADLQSDISSFLTAAQLNLEESQVVRREVQTSDGTRRRIDIEVGQCVIEVKKDISNQRALAEAEKQLAGYVITQSNRFQTRYVGVLTDGKVWYLYRLNDESLQKVDEFRLPKPAEIDIEKFRVWVESILATEDSVKPVPEEIERRLGVNSPSYRLDHEQLTELYNHAASHPEVQMKRHLWARLLRTALGSSFKDDAALFVDHTLLVMEANIIAHAVIGIDLHSSTLTPDTLFSGTRFHEAQIYNVVQSDFFDWVLKAPGGESFVRNLVRQVRRFSWENVEHDVLKVLYESVISQQTRKSLGEYYTADWLAEQIVEDVVTSPLQQRVMDPACGSGTFVFHAVRQHLSAADAAGMQNSEAITSVTGHVFGMDIHPVSAVLARVTYLLAIGLDRLQDRDALSVPVYLGDSMQWSRGADTVSDDILRIEVDTPDLAVSEERQASLFSTARALSFPLSSIDDPGTFDRLISDLTGLAQTHTDSRTRKPDPSPILRRYGVAYLQDKETLAETFEILCSLNADEQNHIWGYFVRNQVRPLWLSLPQRRVDVLIGNPPWVAYRYMTAAMQKQFKSFSKLRHLWAGGAVATQQDLVALFIARTVEQFLSPTGSFGFVAPKSVLSRMQYSGFRSGKWATNLPDPITNSEVTVRVAFARPWDMEDVEPALFPVPSAVILGKRSTYASEMPPETVRYWGKLPVRATRWAQAKKKLRTVTGNVRAVSSDSVARSPYDSVTFNGATIYPRSLFFVEERVVGPLGVAKGLKPVHSLRTSLEKTPWKELPDLTGTVESVFVRKVLLGSTVLPYRTIRPWRAVLPILNDGLLSEESIQNHEHLAAWWSDAETRWEAHKGEQNKLSLMERLNYQRGLSRQLGKGKHRVIYAKSGGTLAAAYVADPSLILENGLYWLVVPDAETAHYLVAILNSQHVLAQVSSLQSRGLLGARHFDKYVWHLPIPRYNNKDELHRKLSSHGEDAEKIARETVIPEDMGFQKARQLIKKTLSDNGISHLIEEAAQEIVPEL